jgi:hypothetical protein
VPSEVCAATVIAAAAVFLGDRNTHEPEFGETRDDVVGKSMLAVELLRDRGDPLLRELADRAAEQLVLVGEVEVHYYGDRREASSVRSRTP